MIELCGISKVYKHVFRGPVHAVRDVSLTVEPGQLVALTGPQGAGKTTLLRILGLRSGQVVLDRQVRGSGRTPMPA
jgi:ABC-2 type transport system ATP-binding protein